MNRKQLFKELEKKIGNKAKHVKKYQGKKIFGFPGSYPLEIGNEDYIFKVAEKAYSYALKYNANAIELHHNPWAEVKSYEDSDLEDRVFWEYHEMEKELVKWIIGLLNGDPCKIYGYVSTGGTNSNIEAFWTARNYFQSKYNNPNFQFIFADDGVTHYSVLKALDILGFTGKRDTKDDNGNFIKEYYILDDRKNKIVHLKMDDNGKTVLNTQKFNDLENVPTIITINAPSINTGLIDDLSYLKKIIEQSKIKKENIHLHIDGAFGMFVYPFLNQKVYNDLGGILLDNYNKEKYKLEFLDFRNDKINNTINKTISIDLHKMGLIPYSTGLYLSNIYKGYEYIETVANYIRGGLGNTLAGSRSAASVVSAWSAMRVAGESEYKKIMIDCLEKTNLLLETFNEMEIKKHFQVIGNPIINIFAVKLNSDKLTEKWEKLVDDFTIVTVTMRKGQMNLYRFVVMPHVSLEAIYDFKTKLNKILK